MSFREAADLVGKDIPFLPGKKKTPYQPTAKRQEPPQAPKLIDPGLWHERTQLAISRASKSLLESPERLEWLMANRGITAETAERFRLGWVARDLYKARSDFGLPPEMNKQGKPKKLFVPTGLVIPGPSRIRVRRENPGEFGKYYILPGSGNAPLTINFDQAPDFTPCLIVESELDAILLSQEVEKMVMPQFAFLATGSTSNGPSEELLENLRQRPFVLISLDGDEAGSKASWQKWLGVLDNAERSPIPASWGKDHTEAFLGGHDLGKWLDACIKLVMRRLPVGA